MKNLTFLLLAFFLVSCAKSDMVIEDEALDSATVQFTARSQKNLKRNFHGHLAGETTRATGQVIFNFAKDNSGIYFKLMAAGIEDVTGAYLYHRHMAHDHVIFDLSGNVPGVTNGILAEGFLTDGDITCTCTEMNHHAISRIRDHIEAGEVYVVIETIEQSGNIEGVLY